MGLLSKLLGEKTADRMSAGFRGRPDFDTRAWAAARGLDYRDQSSQLGYLGAFTWHQDLQYNVVRGVLPGGERGVLLHRIKLFDPDIGGTFYGVKSETAGGVSAKSVLSGGLIDDRMEFFRVPHTLACVRIPEATGTLHGLYVARRSERYREGDGDVWRRRHLDEFGIEGWAAVVRKRADDELADEVLAGPVRDLLSHPREDGFVIEFMYGQLLVYQQHFLKENGELDDFCGLVSRLARGIRELCEPRLRPLPFETPLPEPPWLEFVSSRPDEQHILAPQGVWLERIVKIAGERGGLAIENSLDFHRAFPHLAVPGEAYGVMRGDGIRFLCLVEKRAEDLEALKKEWPDAGGPIGCDAVVLPAPGRPDTPDGVDGVVVDGYRHVIRDEVLATWMAREWWQATGEHFDVLESHARSLLA